MSDRLKIFVDADDTILQSSETVIDILNNKFQISPRKTIENLKDWGYRSIYNNVSGEMISKIYESEEFFSQVRVNPAFDAFYNIFKDKLDFHIVTKGTYVNLKKKEKYFKDRYPEIHFIGCPLYYEDMNYSKESVDMQEGIQIDDRVDCLSTNAGCKILYKNYKDFEWNKYTGEVEGNLYIANTWKDIETCVDFFLNHREFLNGGM